jgi:hypothetical protein
MALTEQQIQKAVLDHFAWRARPGIWLCQGRDDDGGDR